MAMFWDKLSDVDTLAHIVYSLILLVVLGSALIARARARGRSGHARNATIWVAIAAGLLLAYSLKDEALGLGRRLAAELVPQLGMAGSDSITFRARADGHFVVEALVDGSPVIFLVDSGASDVVLSPHDAARLGLKLDKLRFDRMYQTANGIVRGAPIRLKRVAVGPIELTDVRASVNGAPMETSLLGMTFLTRLSAWRAEGDRLTLVR
jgi:aspartyl protease family protein